MTDLHKYLIGTIAGILLCLLTAGGYYLFLGNKQSLPLQAGHTTQLDGGKTVPSISAQSDDILGKYTDTSGKQSIADSDLTPEQKDRLFAAQTANESLAKQHDTNNLQSNKALQEALRQRENFEKSRSEQTNTIPAALQHSQQKQEFTADNGIDQKKETQKKQVRDLIVQGKSAAEKEQLIEAISAFDDAAEIMPEDTDFEASSFHDMAQSIFALSKKVSQPKTAENARDKAEMYIKNALTARDTEVSRKLYADIIDEQKKAVNAKKQQELLARQQAEEREQAEKKNNFQRKQVRNLIGQGKNAARKNQLSQTISAFDKASNVMPEDNNFTAEAYKEMADTSFNLSEKLSTPRDSQTARDKAEEYAKKSLATQNTADVRRLYAEIIDAQNKAAEKQRAQERIAHNQNTAKEKQKEQKTVSQKAPTEQPKMQERMAQNNTAAVKNTAKETVQSGKEQTKAHQQVEKLLAQGNAAAQRKQLNNTVLSFDRAGKIMPNDAGFAATSYQKMAETLFTLSETLPNKQAAQKAHKKAEEYINKSLAVQTTPEAQTTAAKIAKARKTAEKADIAVKQQGAVDKRTQGSIRNKHAAAEQQKQNTGNTEQAAAALGAAAAKKAQADTQARKREVDSLVQQGKKAATAGNFSQAHKSFEKADSLMPMEDKLFSASQYREMADTMQQLAKKHPAHKAQALDSGTAYIKKSITAKHDDGAAHFIYAQIAEEQNNTALAVQELEAAVRFNSNNYLYNYELGRKYFEQKKYAKARSSFEQTVKLNPKYEAAFFNLGITHKVMNAHDAALTSFSKAAALKPDYIRAWIEMARVQDKKQNYADSVKHYQKALTLESSNISALKEMAQVYAKMKDRKQAERYFKQALTLGDTDPVTYYNLATVLLDENKASDALQYAEKAISSNNKNAYFLYAYALALEQNKKEKEAKEYYIQAIAADGQYIKPRINLGRMYLEAGKLNDAEQQLQAAHKIEVSNFEVNTNLGKLYGLKNEYGKSIDYYTRAIKAMPKDIDAHQNLAAAYLSADLKENARDTYMEILKLNPQTWDSYYELGKLYITMNNKSGAKKILEELLKKKPNYRHAGEIRKLLASL